MHRLAFILLGLTLFSSVSPSGAGTLEHPTSFNDCNNVPEYRRIIQMHQERAHMCMDKVFKSSRAVALLRDSTQTSCYGKTPRTCASQKQRACDSEAKLRRAQDVCRAKFRRHLAEEQRAKQARLAFEQRQRELERRRADEERQRQADMRRQFSEIHRYKDNAIISSHLVGRLGGLQQPPLGGSYYLSQTLTAAGTRFVTNSVADSTLRLDRAVAGNLAGTARVPMSSHQQSQSLMTGLQSQANRTGGAAYQLPLENMSVQSALVSGFLTLLVQSQLDGESADLQGALANLIAFGVTSLLDDDTGGSSTDTRRSSMMTELEEDRKEREYEAVRNKNYNYCLKVTWGAHSNGRQPLRARNGCPIRLKCGVAQYKNETFQLQVLNPGESIRRSMLAGKTAWHRCEYAE